MVTRRQILGSALAPLAASAQSGPTEFQLACMTLPYSRFSLERALRGIAASGFRAVAWGTSHEGKPCMAVDAPPSEARALGARCRDMGLEPVMMFTTVNLEQPNAYDAHARRVEQAAAAGMPFVLTFGRTRPGEYEAAVDTLRRVGPLAKKAGVTVVVKQHGGNTATGRMCARLIQDSGAEGIKVCYDAGNVLDYENADPISDIRQCWWDVRAFALKDHRNTPVDQDCAPGLGEIDHYQLLMPVARMGIKMPLAFENIFEPIVPRPDTAEGIDRLASNARQFMETVIRGVQLALR
ncbi:MAG: sugar phosphate isomerase/epimerase [Bryobacterales bacterium]|nr:sugar phosphate isomerase/epimerase [Bryobacterales bacterium]